MNGLIMPGVSAGSNQVGGTETCRPHVSWLAGLAAKDGLAPPTARPRAARARRSRRLMLPIPDARVPSCSVDERIHLLPVHRPLPWWRRAANSLGDGRTPGIRQEQSQITTSCRDAIGAIEIGYFQRCCGPPTLTAGRRGAD